MNNTTQQTENDIEAEIQQILERERNFRIEKLLAMLGLHGYEVIHANDKIRVKHPSGYEKNIGVSMDRMKETFLKGGSRNLNGKNPDLEKEKARYLREGANSLTYERPERVINHFMAIRDETDRYVLKNPSQPSASAPSAGKEASEPEM